MNFWYRKSNKNMLNIFRRNLLPLLNTLFITSVFILFSVRLDLPWWYTIIMAVTIFITFVPVFIHVNKD